MPTGSSLRVSIRYRFDGAVRRIGLYHCAMWRKASGTARPRNCGSPVYSESASYPDLVRIRLGSLDQPAGRTPDYHYLLSAKADWDTSDDQLPRFGDG